ncbi:farnesol dehydrogenase-like [Achroia grisella]|uniref:farnesol dehydrogenase-like n=1 Tax=Achroia grisella TaxID=688607 RepID=UPI0027D2F149|nr:farnesol dehydrogenase-like [Achroia grisella]
MERWRGRVAVVTGASAGIGAAICLGLANAGVCVVGLARRVHLVEELSSKVEAGKGSIHSRQCDVSKLADVVAAFNWIEETFGGTDILVNNAGVMNPGFITDLGDQPLKDEQLIATIDTNVTGLVMCTRRAISSMVKRQFDGHVININSIAGHYIPFSPLFNVYPSSKHAVTAFTHSLLNELAAFKNKIKVTGICPGLVDTDMASEAATICPTLRPSDIADTVLYALSTPPTVNINEISISPITEKRL